MSGFSFSSAVFIFFNGHEHYFPTKRNPHESNKMEHHLFTFRGDQLVPEGRKVPYFYALQSYFFTHSCPYLFKSCDVEPINKTPPSWLQAPESHFLLYPDVTTFIFCLKNRLKSIILHVFFSFILKYHFKK